MHVFVTGATGWVGAAVVDELLAHGHEVTGLARSEAKASALAAKGVRPVIGSLENPAVLADAAQNADAVAHLAFNHDFSRFAESAQEDRQAIEALGAALSGTRKPLLITAGLALLAPGRVAVESDRPITDPSYPRRSEQAAAALVEAGLRVTIVRLAPSVHGLGERHGFVPILIDMALRTGVSAYVGDGENRWPAVHVSDAGRLYRLALESDLTEPAYHAAAEEGVRFRDIAQAIGDKLGLPVEPREPEHFGWFAGFAGGDMPASNALTRDRLGWTPTGPSLLSDIRHPDYYAG
ncbi:3-beta hydroxysteroid dehydrogenase [Brevundimonas sp. LM2]|uniref:SDR family oxidoreductase n=1 Tax=Brevundimonas sp. LM2 TaxID=1938605 RepID=UPI000983EC22|nr:SDR family oxidoreductase [Brevundimonas sp. LM2]AQR61877.1 3-beta hydroxysteroid dehydrogenase [Brevundimonas sp. LM2]